MNIRKIKRNFRRNTKAISPVIATLLMIAIAVVASLVTYAWVMGYMSFTTDKTGKAIQIQSVTNSTTGTPLDTTDSTLTIYVQNVGDSTVEFTANSIFLNGAHADFVAVPPLAQGSTAALIVDTADTDGVVSFTVDIKVTTLDGTYSTLKKTFP